MKKRLISAVFVVLTFAAFQGLVFAGKIRNPLATNDQLYAENLAMYIVASSEVVAAKETLSTKWKALFSSVSDEQLAYHQEAVDEMAFSMTLSVISNDPNYPKFVSTLAAPHSWYGMDVPGSRVIFDNPDTIYRSVGIDPTAGYVVRGKRGTNPPVNENYSLFDARSNTLSNIKGERLVTKPDGSFKITVDSTAADGRKNHIQTTSAAATVYTRNTVNDWNQDFTSLSIERVPDGTPLPDPRTFDELVSQTAAAVTSIIYSVKSLNTRANAQAVNTLPAVQMGGTGGLLSTQAATYSAWELADDEALIVKVKLGGAKYFICPVYNKWMTTTDYINHTQTLNNAQATPNPNGTYTFVISVKDPGVYNWIDTAGMHEGYLNLRWQGLPGKTPASGGPAATMRLVKLADLKSTLPAHTKYVTKQERKKQLRERATSYAKRYSEY